jgi:predicted nucleotidyltransferase
MTALGVCSNVMDMDPIVREFADRVRTALGPHLKELILFGSRARGDARPDSDYDVLVVVDERTGQERESVLDVTADLLTKHGALFGCLYRSVDEWRRLEGFPLQMNIAREGVAL